MSAYAQAVARIDATPELEPYRNAILIYDWYEGTAHHEWAATASVGEIIDWAKSHKKES